MGGGELPRWRARGCESLPAISSPHGRSASATGWTSSTPAKFGASTSGRSGSASPTAPSCSSPPSATPPPGRSSICEPRRWRRRVAAEMRAAKLVFLCARSGVLDARGAFVRELTFEEAKALAADLRHAEDGRDDGLGHRLRQSIHACRNGVSRVHIIDRRIDGALLLELFSRDGVGTMINADTLRLDPVRDHRRRGRYPRTDPPAGRLRCAGAPLAREAGDGDLALQRRRARRCGWSHALRCFPTRRTGSPSLHASPWTAHTAAGSTASACSISSNARPGRPGGTALRTDDPGVTLFRERGFVEAGHSIRTAGSVQLPAPFPGTRPRAVDAGRMPEGGRGASDARCRGRRRPAGAESGQPASRRDVALDHVEHDDRIRRPGDRPADDQIVGAGADRITRVVTRR